MKQKLLKLIAICLVLASLVPYASAAGDDVYLWSEDGIDLNNVVINVGDTITIGCDAGYWWNCIPNSNYIRITMSGGGAISMRGSDHGSGGALATVTGVRAGQSTLSFYIEACLRTYNDDYINSDQDNSEENTPDNENDFWVEFVPAVMPMSYATPQLLTNNYNYNYNDYTDSVPGEEITVLATTSVSVPITVIGEEEPEIELPLPELEIIDSNGKDCSGRTISLEEGETGRFTCHLVTGCLEGSDYYYTPVDGIRWSLNAKSDEYTISSNKSGLVGSAEVECLKGDTKGTLTASMTVALMCGQEIIETQTIKSQVYLQSEETELVAGELFEEVDVDKVPNPFVNLSKDAWYYDSFMSAYAWGLLDGIDFSEKQDGSMILSMKKTVFDGSEENVSATFVAESEWSAKNLSTANMGAVLHTLGSSPATISLLANNKGGAFVQPSNKAHGRAGLVQEVYNTEKRLVKEGKKAGPVASYTKNPFTDVPSGKAYTQAVLWGAGEGIVKGYGGGVFGPGRGITRQDFCTILYRYAKDSGIALSEIKGAKTFTDGSSIGGYAKNAVAACQRAGIIKGYPDGSFQPNKSISIQEAVEMLNNFLCR